MVRRRPAFVLGLICAVLLVGAASCGDDEPRSGSSSSAAPDPASGSAAPDGGQLRIVDSGFTVTTDKAAIATFGVVVENTSKDRAAVGVRATARFLDSAGQPVSPLGRLESLNSKAATIMPGQRMGLGDLAVTAAEGDRRSAASMQLEISVSRWYRASRVTGVTVRDVRHETAASGAETFPCTVESHLTQPLTDPRVVVIVRDRSGKVVGGLFPDRSTTPWPPGSSTQQPRFSTLGSVPITADPARTEIYVGDAEVDQRPV